MKLIFVLNSHLKQTHTYALFLSKLTNTTHYLVYTKKKTIFFSYGKSRSIRTEKRKENELMNTQTNKQTNKALVSKCER